MHIMKKKKVACACSVNSAVFLIWQKGFRADVAAKTTFNSF